MDYKELIPSSYMRKCFKEHEKTFSDSEKATIIWNSPMNSWTDKLTELKEILDITNDEKLKKELVERIAYEEKAFSIFIDNHDSRCTYVVLDSEGISYGYFKDYELAKIYGIQISNEFDLASFKIEKQAVFNNENNSIMIEAYCGSENAAAFFNRCGDVIDFYSMEYFEYDIIPREINGKKYRFEDAVIGIPFTMEKGMIVELLFKDESSNGRKYAVLKDDANSWDNYMNLLKSKEGLVDYMDLNVVVYMIDEAGRWYHEHINPLYINPIDGIIKPTNPKETAEITALKALSDFMKDNSQGNYDSVYLLSKRYAIVSNEEDMKHQLQSGVDPVIEEFNTSKYPFVKYNNDGRIEFDDYQNDSMKSIQEYLEILDIDRLARMFIEEFSDGTINENKTYEEVVESIKKDFMRIKDDVNNPYVLEILDEDYAKEHLYEVVASAIYELYFTE